MAIDLRSLWIPHTASPEIDADKLNFIKIRMSPRLKRILGSVAFAALWTAGMLWWNAPLDQTKIIVTLITGVLAGFLWYWLGRRFGR
jgi:hypothetical protein